MSTDPRILFDALITGNARKVMDELFPREPQQPMSRCPDLVEGSSPADGPRTAGAVIPTQCSKCGPSCTCDIAWNE